MENVVEICVFRHNPWDEYSPLDFFIFGKEDTYYSHLVNNQRGTILKFGKSNQCPYFQEIIDHLNSFLPEGRKFTLDVPYRVDKDFIEIVNKMEKFCFKEAEYRDTADDYPSRPESDSDEEQTYGRWYHDEE